MRKKLTVNDEVLFRQIHPSSIQAGEPGSDRFRPSSLDENMLSTDRGSMTTAQDAHALYTSTGKKSAAVYGLSVGEFQGEAVACFEDPVKDVPSLPDNPAHALADYAEHDEKKQKVIAKRLKKAAVDRGCLFQPPALES